MIDSLIKVVSSVAKIPVEIIAANRNRDDLWDSFTKVEIILEVESVYRISFTEADLEAINSYQSIEDMLRSKIG